MIYYKLDYTKNVAIKIDTFNMQKVFSTKG